MAISVPDVMGAPSSRISGSSPAESEPMPWIRIVDVVFSSPLEVEMERPAT